MRELQERSIDGEGRLNRKSTGRTVTVNVRESPLAWLAARGLVTQRQLGAGERLRADYERAALSARVTMRWQGRVDGGSGPEASITQLAARQRFDGALAAAGPGLADILWRVICAGEGLPAAEKALAWPARAGRVVLLLALDRVASYYGLP